MFFQILSNLGLKLRSGMRIMMDWPAILRASSLLIMVLFVLIHALTFYYASSLISQSSFNLCELFVRGFFLDLTLSISQLHPYHA